MSKELLLLKRFSALPVSYSENEDQFFLRRGATVIRLPKNAANQLVKSLMSAFDDAEGVLVKAVVADIPTQLQTTVLNIIEKLVVSNFLVQPGTFIDSEDKAFDVFCWDYGKSSKNASTWRSNHHWSFVGSKNSFAFFTQVLAQFQIESSFVCDQSDVIAQLKATDAELEDSRKHVIFALSEAGDAQLLRNINQWAIDAGYIFYPMLILEYTGHIGPIVIPGETACYECLRARENAAMFELENRRAAQANLDIASVSYPPLLPQNMLTTAVSNAIRFFSDLNPPNPNTLQLVNLIAGTTSQHKVLEIPWCRVCGSREELARMASRPLKIFKYEVIG